MIFHLSMFKSSEIANKQRKNKETKTPKPKPSDLCEFRESQDVATYQILRMSGDLGIILTTNFVKF